MTKDRLPQAYLKEMEKLLGEEYQAYLDSLERPGNAGIRLNTGKITGREWEERSPFPTEQVPWAENGRFCGEGAQPAKDPYYYAGLYYIQEPSAMAPAALLPVEPGDRVLDLCAAPGGKSTELGSRLRGRGLLFSNDISSSRAKALVKNLELFGISNSCVCSEQPERLAELLPGYFNKILVDAPCSGEGMFRREESMVKDWEKRGPAYYGPIQRKILRAAADMLSPGGVLVYSTCTFSPYEDEETVLEILKEREDLEPDPMERFPGAAEGLGLPGSLRLFPHRLRGEGHFVARLRKKADGRKDVPGPEKKKICGITAGSMNRPGLPSLDPASEKMLSELLRGVAASVSGLSGVSEPESAWRKRLSERGGALYLLPEGFPEGLGLRFLRTGLFLGEVKKGRLEPSQPLAMVLSPKALRETENALNVFSMNREDGRVIRYLKGETISLEENEPDAAGWTLICVDGFPLGWGKGNGRTIKNKYYPGWRWL